MCHASAGQRAATLILSFAFRGGLFWYFTGAGGLICQNFQSRPCRQPYANEKLEDKEMKGHIIAVAKSLHPIAVSSRSKFVGFEQGSSGFI
jgi:hypothetical protein